MRHNPTPKTAQTPPNILVKNRVLIGMTSVLLTIGSFGFYLFHLQSPDMQDRLESFSKVRQQRNNLTSLLHQKDLQQQKQQELIRQKHKHKKMAQALLSQDNMTSAFQTTIQAAPDEKQVKQETINSFQHQDVTVDKDQSIAALTVAFKPDNNISEMDADYDSTNEADISETIVQNEKIQTDKSPLFAIKIMTSRSLYVIEERWYELKEADQDNSLEELQPKFTVTEISKGKNDYTLLAGPFDKAAEAINACKELKSLLQHCSEAIYQGDNLFQSDNQEDDFPVGSLGSDGAPIIK